MPDLTTVILALIAALFGGGGFWAFVVANRKQASQEYRNFVSDLQQERRDRERAMRRHERRIEFLTEEVRALENDVQELERVCIKLGGKPPKRTKRRPWNEHDDDEDAEEEQESNGHDQEQRRGS